MLKQKFNWPLNYTGLLGVALCFLVLFALIPSANANDKIVELTNKLEDTELSRNDRAITLKDLAWELRHSDLEQAKKHANEALFIASRDDNNETKALIYNVLGTIERIGSNYTAAEKHLLKSIEYSKLIGNRETVSSAQNALASTYRFVGKYGLALNNYNEVLSYKKSIKPKEPHIYRHIAITLSNMAAVYTQLEEFDKATEYHLKAKQTYLDNDLQVSIATQINLAIAYKDNKEYALALQEIDAVLASLPKDKVDRYVLYTYQVKGDIYKESAKYKLAIEHYKKTELLAQTLKIPLNEAMVNIEMAHCYAGLGDFEQSMVQIEKAKVLSPSLTLRIQHSLAQTQREIFQQYEMFDKAFYALIEENKLQTEIDEQANEREIGRIEASYEFEQQRQKEALEREQQIQKEEAKRQKREGH